LEVLKEVAAECHIDGPVFERRKVRDRHEDDLHILRSEVEGLLVQVNGEFAGATDVVDELATTRAQINNCVRIGHEFLEERLAEDLPELILLLPFQRLETLVVQVS